MAGWALLLVSRGSNEKDTTDLVVLSVTFHAEHHEYRRSAAGCKALTLKKCTALGGEGGIISKGKDE